VKLNPKESTLLYDLGRIQLELKDTTKAENTYTRFIQTDSTRYYSWSARAMLRMLKNDNDGALSDYNQAIKYKSTYAGDYINRGILNNEKKNYKQALLDYDNAIKLDKTEFLGYYNRGMIRVTLGDNNRALADFATAQRLDSTNMEVRWKKAILELTLKNYKNSIDDYQIILAKYPYFIPALQGIADAEDALGNIKSAFKYRQLASNIESNKEFYKQKSKATIVATNKMAAGQKITTSKNAALFNRFDDINNSDSDSNPQNNENNLQGNVQDINTAIVNERNFVLTYYAKNNEIRRTNVYYPLIEQYNDKKLTSSVLKITNNELVLTNELVNSHFDLITNISKLITIDSNNPDLYFNRAIEFALVLNQKSAIDDLNKTIELKPDFMLAYFCRANLRYQLDESTKLNVNTVDQVFKVKNSQLPNESQFRLNQEMILRDLDKVTEFCPDFSFAYYNKANLLCTQKDFKTAIINYTKAIEIDRDFAEAYFNRGLTYLFIGEDAKGLADLSKAGELGIYKAYNLIQRFKK
jgi:tetratricopeptide (TPR) repeat protein